MPARRLRIQNIDGGIDMGAAKKVGNAPQCECGEMKVLYGVKIQRWECRACKRKSQRRRKAKLGGASRCAKAWYSTRREVYLAHKAVENAVKAGRLTKQPCERCGAAQVHAHHDDYSQRLNVRWLCPKHHKEVHRELEAQAASSEARKSASLNCPAASAARLFSGGAA